MISFIVSSFRRSHVLKESGRTNDSSDGQPKGADEVQEEAMSGFVEARMNTALASAIL